nr:MAG TPA: hypothetical protein [Caudoviricetes sp.]
MPLRAISTRMFSYLIVGVFNSYPSRNHAMRDLMFAIYHALRELSRWFLKFFLQCVKIVV